MERLGRIRRFREGLGGVHSSLHEELGVDQLGLGNRVPDLLPAQPEVGPELALPGRRDHAVQEDPGQAEIPLGLRALGQLLRRGQPDPERHHRQLPEDDKLEAVTHLPPLTVGQDIQLAPQLQHLHPVRHRGNSDKVTGNSN